MSVAGFAAAVAAAVFNGSFAALSKVPAVRRSRIDPVFFNFLCCCGVALSSAAVIPLLQATNMPVGFTFFGALAGALFVFAGLFSFAAVPLVGLSVAQGIWGGSAIIVSFAWGAVGPAELRAPLGSLPLSILALALLLTGVAGIARNGEIAAALRRAPPRADSLLDGASGEGPSHQDADDDERARIEHQPNHRHEDEGRRPSAAPAGAAERWAEEEAPAAPLSWPRSSGATAAAPTREQPPSVHAPAGVLSAWQRRAAGTLSALLVGLFGGSVLVPNQLAPAELSGFALLPSFGLGAFGAAAVVAAGYAAVRRCRGEALELGSAAAVPAGILSGVVWNAGNLCAVYAMGPSGGLNYGVAYPIVQCALLVSGLLGIFVFREIREPAAIAVFFTAAATLIAGGAVLGYAGPGSAGTTDDSDTGG